MARKKINAEVTCWHAATGASGPVGEVTDISSLRIKLPGLDWLHRIGIDVNAKTGEVRINVQTNNEDDYANSPTLTVTPHGTFTVQS